MLNSRSIEPGKEERKERNSNSPMESATNPSKVKNIPSQRYQDPPKPFYISKQSQ
jgi:hypothetical protein